MLQSMGKAAPYGKVSSYYLQEREMVGRAGFEPATNWLKASSTKSPGRTSGLHFTAFTFPIIGIYGSRKSLISNDVAKYMGSPISRYGRASL